MGFRSSCIKGVLNILNSLRVLFGIYVIGIATKLLDDMPLAYIVYLYLVGGLIFVSAIVGFWSIWKENVSMTATYAFMLLAQVIITLLANFGIKINKNCIQNFASEKVQKMWNMELVKPGAMDPYQRTYQCCGRYGPSEYMSINRTLPDTCYPIWNYETSYFTTGCVQSAVDKFMKLFENATDTNWISAGITTLMAFGAFYLVGSFRKASGHRLHY